MGFEDMDRHPHRLMLPPFGLPTVWPEVPWERELPSLPVKRAGRPRSRPPVLLRGVEYNKAFGYLNPPQETLTHQRSRAG